MTGFKHWVDRETLTHTDLNGYLMDQVVPRFADAAARDAALPAPTEGQMAHVLGVGLLIYAASAWVTVPTGALTSLATLTITDDLRVDDDVTLAAGSVLTWATDTNLYRSAANVLKTDDTFNAAGGLQANGLVVVTVSGTQTLTGKTLSSPAITGTPTGITKTHVGLSLVDNTADASKPVSTAQATADGLRVLKAGDTMSGSLTFADGANIVTGTTTGTKIGGVSQKIGFFGVAPVTQPINTDLRVALINLGLMAAGSATPLDINTAAINCGALTCVTLTASGAIVANANAAAFALTAQNQHAAGHGLTMNLLTATNGAFCATVVGDANYRFFMDANGKMFWGDGTAARDTNLYRSAADTLKTDDNLVVALTTMLLGRLTAANDSATVSQIALGRPAATDGVANAAIMFQGPGVDHNLIVSVPSVTAATRRLRFGRAGGNDYSATAQFVAFGGDDKIYFGTAEDTNLYRRAADSLATDDDLAINLAGKGLRVKEGANAKMGVSTLVAGSVVVANTSVTANSRIFLTGQADGGTPGDVRVSTRTAGTSFTITSSSGADTSVIAWHIIEPA